MEVPEDDVFSQYADELKDIDMPATPPASSGRKHRERRRARSCEEIFSPKDSYARGLSSYDDARYGDTRSRSPRDWTPPDEEESFNPSELPEAEPTSHIGLFAVLSWVLAAAALLLTVLSYFHILPAAPLFWKFCALATFSFAALAAFLSSPSSRNTDFSDDGARL